jgi:hypothetical protein
VIDVRTAGNGFGGPGSGLYRSGFREFAFEAIPGSGVVSGGSTRTLTIPKIRLATAVAAGVDLMSEAMENNVDLFRPATGGAPSQMFSYPATVSAFVAFPIFGLGSVTEEAGIEYGSPNAAAMPAFPVVGIIRFFGCGDGSFRLRCAKGDGSAHTTVVLPGGPYINLGSADAHRMTIIYVPGVSVTAVLDGVTSVTQSNPATIPAAGSPHTFGAGIFVHAGPANPEQSTGDFGYLTVQTSGRP